MNALVGGKSSDPDALFGTPQGASNSAGTPLHTPPTPVPWLPFPSQGLPCTSVSSCSVEVLSAMLCHQHAKGCRDFSGFQGTNSWSGALQMPITVCLATFNSLSPLHLLHALSSGSYGLNSRMYPMSLTAHSDVFT